MSDRKNISSKFIFTVFAVFTAILTATRIYQLFAITEENSTGFFKVTDVSVYLLYIISAVFCIVLLALVTFSNSVTASKSYRGRHQALSVCAALFAAGLAIDVAVCASKFISGIKVAPSGEMFAFLFANGLVFSLFEAIFGLVACIYFIIYSLSYAEGKQNFSEYKLLAVAPLFWAMARMIGKFLTKISFTVVADLMLELIMLAFMMLFLISFARISSQICQKNEMRKAMGCGLVSAVFAIALGVSRLAAVVAGKSVLLPKHFGLSFNAVDLAFGAFAAVYVYAGFKSGRDASEDDLLEYEDSKPQEEIDEDFLDD